MHIVHRLAPGLLAGSLVLSGASGALAAKAKAKVRFAVVSGQISAVAGNTFTLTLNPKAATQGKTTRTVQVTLAPNAKLQPRAGTTGAIANGYYAVVVGTRAESAVTARRVIYSATAFRTARVASGIRARHTLAALSHRTARGTVQSSTATSLVITTRAGKTLTFQLTSTTQFRVKGQLSQTAPTFASGQQVVVRYTRDKTTSQLTASAVNVRS